MIYSNTDCIAPLTFFSFFTFFGGRGRGKYNVNEKKKLGGRVVTIQRVLWYLYFLCLFKLFIKKFKHFNFNKFMTLFFRNIILFLFIF